VTLCVRSRAQEHYCIRFFDNIGAYLPENTISHSRRT